MLKKTVSLFIISALIVTLLSIYSGCASKGFPTGGPQDKTPPEIIATYPVADSTYVQSLSLIKIQFSEMMNESSIANSIFISPPIEFSAEWDSYSELSIYLKDSLRKEQTYVVVLGAKISDIRNNKLSDSFQLAFSTGAKIDQGVISGRVYGLDRRQTLTIFAFELNSDTLRFDKNKPDYVSQTGDKGRFTLSYLKNAAFRVFAVEDQNNNLLLDADFEQIAIPLKDIVLDSSVNRYAGLNFRLTKIDTIAPLLSNIRSKNNTQFEMRFSEGIVVASSKQIAVMDSISKIETEILSTSKSVEADNILEVFTSKMDSGNVYLCQIRSLADSSGNMARDTTLSFVAGKYVQPDTFRIINFTPQDSAWSLHPAMKVYLDFSNPLDKNSFENKFHLVSKDRDTIAGKFYYPSAYEVEFSPLKNLLLDSIYTIHLDMPRIYNVWGDSLGDSILTRHFKINNGDDYGEIAGMVLGTDSVSQPLFIETTRIGRKNEKFGQWLYEKKSYLFNYLPDGSYKMNVYLDSDSSGNYSPGHLFPFQFSELFIYSDDTVKVRKRWETSGVNISISK